MVKFVDCKGILPTLPKKPVFIIYEHVHDERLKLDTVPVFVGSHHFNFHITPVLAGAYLESCSVIQLLPPMLGKEEPRSQISLKFCMSAHMDSKF